MTAARALRPLALTLALALGACRQEVPPRRATTAGPTAGPPAATQEAAAKSGASSGTVSATDGGAPPSDSAAEGWRGAAEVVRRYYAAIDSRDYAAAYALWGDGGRASGKSRSEFEAGFARTASVRVAIGDSGHMEGAAGSRYATVPVTVDAVQRDGTRQRFAGSYVLRRAVVDGATAEQRSWHIYTARLTAVGR